MPEKGARPDRTDPVVLLLDPALGQFRRIGPVQATIIVVPGCWGRRHWDQPPPIICRQRRGMHHGGGPRRLGGVKTPLAGHTHRWEEGNEQCQVRTRLYEGPKHPCVGDFGDGFPYLGQLYGAIEG